MSRGHGHIERRILERMPLTSPCTVEKLARDVWGITPDRSMRSSLGRALRKLADEGLIKRTTIDVDMVRVPAWCLTNADKQRRELAFHEAGHAVIGMALHGYDGIEAATIKPRRVLGRVTPNPTRRWNHANEILTVLAGPIAQFTFSKQPFDWEHYMVSGDRRDLKRHRRRLALDGIAYDEAHYDREARSLVKQWWPQIEAVAKARLKYETLDRAQLRALCRRRDP